MFQNAKIYFLLGILTFLILNISFSQPIVFGSMSGQYTVFSSYNLGLAKPSGKLGLPSYPDIDLSLKKGWNIGFEGVFPINNFIGVGFNIIYSLYPINVISYKDNIITFNGKYKVLTIKPSLFIGSFDPEDSYVLAGSIKGGYSFMIIPKHEMIKSYETSSEKYSSNITGGIGIGVGALLGYKFSASYGICGLVYYDVPRLIEEGISSSHYLSIQIGLLVLIQE